MFGHVPDDVRACSSHMVAVVQYLTGVFCPAGDIAVLVAVVQYLTHILWRAGDLPVSVTVIQVSDQCVLSCWRSPCFGDSVSSI